MITTIAVVIVMIMKILNDAVYCCCWQWACHQNPQPRTETPPCTWQPAAAPTCFLALLSGAGALILPNKFTFSVVVTWVLGLHKVGFRVFITWF